MSDTEDLKQKTISGLFWQFCQKGVGQIISFAISVVLARLLMPEEFGVVALAGMFTVLTGIFIDCGMGTALIQKKDADDLDYCTLFWTQTVFAIIVYLIVYLLAPWFSLLFHSPKLTAVVRILGLGMILGTIGGIQSVIVTRRMDFKVYFYRTMIASILSGVIGIYLAYSGWGVWALVAQNLLSTIIGTITVFWQVRWLPRFIFSFERFKSLIGIGSKFMASGLIGTAFGQLKGYLVGLKYAPTDLAFYNRGEGVPQIFTRNIDSSINAVLFPVFAKLQDDKKAVKNAVRRSIKTSSYLIFPMLLGLAAIADHLVIVLYTEKWEACIPFMQVFCVSECFSIMNTANLQVLRGIGEVNTLLKLELYKKPILVTILGVTMYISPLAIAIGMCIYGIYTMVVNAFPNRKFINYHIKEQLKDVSSNAALAVGMFACVYIIGRLNTNPYLLITIQVVMGVLIYCGLSELLQLDSWQYVKETAKTFFRKFKL
ncbi:MAG: lipopolysaccharide biosynthesis protein [Prevotella sp.]|nr:lipopolysaccharide biosynthesis protein [Prevotella sp.]